MPDVELVAVVDASPARSQTIASTLGVASLDDHRDLFDRIDAVSVAVPTTFHLAVASDFLQRGIATLVEKPLATSVAEAERLVNLAAASQTLLQVGHIERFNPALQALDQSPVRPRFINAERLSSYTFRSTDIGVVLDLMIHDIDLVLTMTSSPVRSVSAVGVSLFGEHEDVANARIEFEDGCVADLTASRASRTPLRKMRIWGADGYASLDFAGREATLIRPSDSLLQGDLDLASVDLSQPAAIKDHLFGKVLEVDTFQTAGRDQLTMELEDFVRAARGLGRPRVAGTDALRAMKLADQVLTSLNSHRWEDSEAVTTTSMPRADGVQSGSILQGPHAWRRRAPRGPSAASGVTRGASGSDLDRRS
jgi:predicted dehydrogenase